jgi:exopolysaccharide biosynthesis polyprenyl glycosylphosphotransferase
MLIGEGFGAKGLSSMRSAAEVNLAAPASDIAAIDPVTVVDLRVRRDRRRPTPRRLSRAEPAWLGPVDTCQRARRSPLPIGLDLVAVGAAVWGGTNSGSAAAYAALTFVAAGLTFGLYRSRTSVEAQGIMWYLERAIPSLLCVATVETLYRGLRDQEVLGAVAMSLAVLVLIRSALWVAVGLTRRQGKGLSRALVVGPQTEVSAIQRRLEVFPEAGLVCVHSYVPRGRRACRAEQSRSLITRLLEEHAIEHVVCITGDVSHDVYKDFVRFAAGSLDITIIEPMARIKLSRSRLGDLTVRSIPAQRDRGTEWWKRVFDMLGSAVLLVALSPVLLVTALAIRFGDPGPVMFRQRRAGRHGKPFTIYKFRSMVAEADHARGEFLTREEVGEFTFKFAEDPRVTRVGAFIRRFSIDELPQLLNVLKGEMSLVGPRPLAFSPDEFDDRANVRFMARPGITGLWQVSGGNVLEDTDMFELDLSYVMTHTFWIDVFLLLKTIPVLISRRTPY